MTCMQIQNSYLKVENVSMIKIKSKTFYQFISVMIIQCCLCLCSLKVVANEKPLIFPVPQHSEVTNENFILDENVSIIIPPNAGNKDIFLANFLVREVSDKYNLALTIETRLDIPANRKVVVMGTINNPIIKKYCREHQLELTAKKPGKEGYAL